MTSDRRPPMQIEDLIGLELFVDTCRLGSISAAARRHHLSQPSATERLRRLERKLGVALLRRGPGGSAPTVEGEAVAEWARSVLASVDQLDIGVSALRSSKERRPLRIMASMTVAEYVLPGWLLNHRTAGGAQVDLSVGNSVAVAEAVKAGRVQLGFVESPRLFTGLRSTVVGGDRLILVVGPTHPWARRRKPLPPEELAETPLMMREPGSGTRDAFEEAMAGAGLVPTDPSAVLASTTALKTATVAGGATVISELAVVPELAAGTLRDVPIAHLDLTRRFRAVWQPSGTDPEAGRFLRRVRAHRKAP
jgi:DNA-binding transcriptional LysR family regulator